MSVLKGFFDICAVAATAVGEMVACCSTLAWVGLDGKLLCFANYIMDEPRGLIAAQHTVLSLLASKLAIEKVG